MPEDQPRGRFGVSSELLRLATDDEGGARAVSLDASAPVGPEGVSAVSLPRLGVALRLQGVSGLIVAAAATALPLSLLVAVRTLAPHIERSMHVGGAGLEAVLVGAVFAGLAAGPAVGLAADRWGRPRVSVVATSVASVAGLLAAVAPSSPLFALFVASVGVAASSQLTTHVAWLAGSSPLGARHRVLAAYALGVLVLGVAGAVVINVMASIAGGWRWGMALSIVGVALAVALARAPAPLGEETGAEDSAADGAEVGIGSTAQRVRRLRSVVALLTAASVLAFVAVGLPLLAAGDLEHHWHQAVGARGRIFVLAGLGAFAGVLAAGRLGERAAARSSSRVMALIGASVAAFGVLVAGSAYLPRLGLVEVAWALAVAALAVMALTTAQAITSVAQPVARGVTVGLLGAYGLIFGGVGATIVLTAVSQADGARLALAMAGLSGVAAGAVLWRSSARFADDVTRTLLDAAEEAKQAEQDAAAHETVHEPGRETKPTWRGGRGRGTVALAARNIDFSYGTRQVLFGVGLEVAEGEVAALLGTNGAGKSTLLRLVAGLDHPSTGAIRVWGRDTTYLEAEQVVGLGVAMLPGGRMSFPGLSVLENLRVGGHTIRRQGSKLRTAIDEVLNLFPILSERRDQRVGTLSGGEQQMLALGRVLLTSPRLLLVDELSLGLAPKAVESLLAIVRRVNEQGTTVLLVEQSANLAMQLAQHALFLERGEVRFDGATAELLRRDDLLRPVFLGRDTAGR